ncbi:MAG: hypothetical protein RL684_246 [Pseudomonadota bacterium]
MNTRGGRPSGVPASWTLTVPLYLLISGCVTGRPVGAMSAAPDPFTNYYGSVLVADKGTGTPYCVRLGAGGRYTLARAGRTLWAGSYELERGLLCLAHWHNPMAMCFPFKPGLAVGEHWSARHDGSAYTMTLKRDDDVPECRQHAGSPIADNMAVAH